MTERLAEEYLPGPCYPEWPEMTKAFTKHCRSEDGETCERCGLKWEDD